MFDSLISTGKGSTSAELKSKLQLALKEHFKHSKYRSVLQRQAVEAVASRKSFHHNFSIIIVILLKCLSFL